MANPFSLKPYIAAISGGHGSTGLVQMQMAIVQFSPGNVPARVFLDTGRSRSYATGSLCRKVQLKLTGKEVVVNSRFEESKPRARSYDKVVINLSTIDGKGNVPITALVTDIVMTLKNPLKKRNLKKLMPRC